MSLIACLVSSKSLQNETGQELMYVHLPSDDFMSWICGSELQSMKAYTIINFSLQDTRRLFAFFQGYKVFQSNLCPFSFNKYLSATVVFHHWC